MAGIGPSRIRRNQSQPLLTHPSGSRVGPTGGPAWDPVGMPERDLNGIVRGPGSGPTRDSPAGNPFSPRPVPDFLNITKLAISALWCNVSTVKHVLTSVVAGLLGAGVTGGREGRRPLQAFRDG